MRRLLKPLVLRLLPRNEDEIVERARGFAIGGAGERAMVRRLAEAFIGGYNTMLSAESLAAVEAAGRSVPQHFRPFFFEGAAMGYIPRGYHAADCTMRSAERALLEMAPAYRYLYYVGLGFWYGFRHPRRPGRLRELAPHLDPMYYPLCYDGFGFKTGFFDYERGGDVPSRLARCPAGERPFAYQGFGRSMFFVFLSDEAGFQELRDRVPAEHRDDLEIGRSLACGFTGVDRPETLVRHIETAPDERDRSARLLGVTWALTAREMNDASYLAACLERIDPVERARLAGLPALCREALAASRSYADWQGSTARAAVAAYAGRVA